MTEKTTILFATQMGASQELAGRAADDLENDGIQAAERNMNEYSIDELKNEENVLIIASTWGDGEPPDDCEDFYKALSESPPLNLKDIRFAVLALGDRSYDLFCEFGKNLDEEFERHGAQRLLERVDCDLDEQERYPIWIKQLSECLKNSATSMVS